MIDNATASAAGARVRAATVRIASPVAPPTRVVAVVVAGVAGAYPPPLSPPRD